MLYQITLEEVIALSEHLGVFMERAVDAYAGPTIPEPPAVETTVAGEQLTAELEELIDLQGDE